MHRRKIFLGDVSYFKKILKNLLTNLNLLKMKKGTFQFIFEINKNSYYKFSSGPFTQQIFKIIEIQKNKINILLGKVKTTINQKDFLFSPV